MTSRYIIEISYDGSAYNGWQKQPGQKTVQGEIEKALSTIFRDSVNIMGAGRTDAGVHAKQQFAHFDLAEIVEVPKTDVLRSLRGLLPQDIFVSDIIKTTPDFHVRFDAIAREYEYRIAGKHDVFYNRYTWVVQSKLELSKMVEVANLILGEHDFATFSKNNPDVNHTRCLVENCKWSTNIDNGYIFTIKANRFLHHMVRSLVGTMVEIGKEKISISEFEGMLISPDRSNCKFTAPPQALFLTRVYYK